jgi:hypothetical protein
MCVPCVAPAVPALFEFLGIVALCLLALLVVCVRKGFRALPGAVTITYRWFSGAILTKEFCVPDTALPPRPYARHVYATLRTIGTVSVPLSLLYPMFAFSLSALVVGTGLGVGVQKAIVWRTERLKLAGAPIKVKAQVRS